MKTCVCTWIDYSSILSVRAIQFNCLKGSIMILFRICSNLQVIHAVNQLCIPGWIACYTLTIPGQTLANMKQTFYWIETLVVSQSLHAGIPACSSIISDDTWYRIGSMINCLTLTCVVTIRIVDKEIYKYYTLRNCSTEFNSPSTEP